MSPMQSGNNTNQREMCGTFSDRSTPSDTPTGRRQNKDLGGNGKVIRKVRSDERQENGGRGAAEGPQCRTWNMSLAS
jgi:hypothetical protein